MKKLFLLIAILFFTSCYKEYKCECSVLDKQTQTVKQNVVSMKIQAKNINEAQAKCDLNSENSISFYKECKIK